MDSLEGSELGINTDIALSFIENSDGGSLDDFPSPWPLFLSLLEDIFRALSIWKTEKLLKFTGYSTNWQKGEKGTSIRVINWSVISKLPGDVCIEINFRKLSKNSKKIVIINLIPVAWLR